MAAVIVDYIRQFLNFSWLTGPVFEKELRVSSRQRRSYVLRFAYISLLLIILLFIWISEVDYRNSNLIGISRMAQAGKAMVIYIVWFQFCAAQIIAAVMLSNSISDEIYHKSLGMLMTTPVTSLQIVTGKLFSKLLQLILLIAISLPLLAIVRLFGGVPWGFVVSSLCITLTTVLFVSSLSLFYSIFCRKAYIVIIITIMSILVFYALLPFLYFTFVEITHLDRSINNMVLATILYQPNPYLMFFMNSYNASYPGRMGSVFFASPYINCAINLFFSFGLLLLSIINVRKAALRQAVGQIFSSRQKKALKKEAGISANNRDSAIISIIGPPVLWKELILPIRRNIKKFRIIVVLIFLALLFYSYWFFEKEKRIVDNDIHGIYVLIFMGLGTLFTIVLSAVSITSEKESRSWPLLLTSTLNDSQIIIGKLYGILARSLPIWFLLFGHILYFYSKDIIHPAAIPLTIVLVTWFVFFICSTGMYFSSVFKHTTTAVIMNFVLVVFLWGIIPLIAGTIGEFYHDRDFIEVCFFTNPFIQILVIIFSTVIGQMQFRHGLMAFSWPNGWKNYEISLFIFGISFCIYMALALIFLWRAKKRLRRKIF